MPLVEFSLSLKHLDKFKKRKQVFIHELHVYLQVVNRFLVLKYQLTIRDEDFKTVVLKRSSFPTLTGNEKKDKHFWKAFGRIIGY